MNICITESLCCIPEINTTLEIKCNKIKIIFFFTVVKTEGFLIIFRQRTNLQEIKRTKNSGLGAQLVKNLNSVGLGVVS